MSPTTTFELHVDHQIAGRKLSGYLLNTAHPVGRTKAKFLIGHGFDPTDIDTLALALLSHTAQPCTRVPTPFGLRLIYEGPLLTPNGTAPMMRSVWQRSDGVVADFITAYPL